MPYVETRTSLFVARDTEQMIVRAYDASVRLVLDGDVKQVASVGAGRAFA